MMCFSPFLAVLIGAYLFLVSLAMLMNPQRGRRAISEFVGDHALMTFAGCVSLIAGLILVIGHNIWSNDWRVAITLVGWLLTIQGVCRLFCPEHYTKWMKEMVSGNGFTVFYGVWFLYGIYLLWMGYTVG